MFEYSSDFRFLLIPQEHQNLDLEKVKSQLVDMVQDETRNFIVPMKKRKFILAECGGSDLCKTPSPSSNLTDIFPTPHPSDSESEEQHHEVTEEKQKEDDFELQTVRALMRAILSVIFPLNINTRTT